GIGDRCVHARDLLGHQGHLFAGRTLCREACYAHLKSKTCFEHFIRCKSVKSGQHSQRTAVERWRFISLRDERSRSLARNEDADGCERTYPSAQGRTAHSQHLREITLRRQAIAWR